jgi:hypothetical protein
MELVSSDLADDFASLTNFRLWARSHTFRSFLRGKYKRSCRVVQQYQVFESLSVFHNQTFPELLSSQANIQLTVTSLCQMFVAVCVLTPQSSYESLAPISNV